MQVVDDALVEYVEVSCRTIGYGTAVQALGHEYEVPFPRTNAIDEIFPALRRQPLSEIGSQAINSGARIERCSPGIIRIACLREPELKIVAKVAPHVLRNRIKMA